MATLRLLESLLCSVGGGGGGSLTSAIYSSSIFQSYTSISIAIFCAEGEDESLEVDGYAEDAEIFDAKEAVQMARVFSTVMSEGSGLTQLSAINHCQGTLLWQQKVSNCFETSAIVEFSTIFPCL